MLLVPVLALAMLALAMPGGASAASSARLAGAARAARAAPGRPVRFGMSGSAVTALQRRLAALKYYPGPADGRFGLDTLEAVWAFQEVQGLPGADYVSSAMQRALAHPHAPQLLVPRGGADRIEINLARRVLVLYRGGKVELISHVSAGGGYYYCSSGGCGYAVTPTGNFRTLSFMPGWIAVPLGYMYNPVFFIGTAYAIHGDIPVPLQPVSHGCVRIPMDIAAFFHTLVRIPGEPVYIRR
ncbi:MAG TPA: L,D-transpeptidase family protein [Streptosporangiaceae bacterium]|nr:L,D-transpeptidase family protein [Streptosporangiaceae bacterium]